MIAEQGNGCGIEVVNQRWLDIDDVAVGKLFSELGPRYRERAGGYLRILKMGNRAGDAAPMAIVQLLDQPTADAE